MSTASIYIYNSCWLNIKTFAKSLFFLHTQNEFIILSLCNIIRYKMWACVPVRPSIHCAPHRRSKNTSRIRCVGQAMNRLNCTHSILYGHIVHDRCISFVANSLCSTWVYLYVCALSKAYHHPWKSPVEFIPNYNRCDSNFTRISHHHGCSHRHQSNNYMG